MPLVIAQPVGGGGGGPDPNPCGEWTTQAEVEVCCDLTGVAPELIPLAIASASFLLDERTFHQFEGTCTTTGRPCIVCSGCGFVGWNWPGWKHYGWAGGCECGPYPVIDLEPYSPAQAVLNVWEGGVLLDPAAYRIDDWHLLVRQDGESWVGGRSDVPWDDPEAGTVVQWTFGQDIPDAGRLAAGALACELAKSCAGLDCAIPANATTVSREGIVVTLQDDVDRLMQLPVVAAFIGAVNPNGYSHPARVYDPDALPMRQTTSA